MKKRIIAFFMCVVVCFFSFNLLSFKSFAASYNVDKLIELCEKFPNGKYWNHVGSAVNNPDGYTSVPCTHHKNGCSYSRPAACECNFYNNAIQCMGYAYMIAEKIVGSNPRQWQKLTTLDVESLKVGDVIRYYNDTHSITVVGVKGDTIAYTGANWGGDCLIKWATMDKSELTGFSYVLHSKSNKSTNTNLTFYKSVKTPTGDKINSGEVWQMSADSSLNVRQSYSTSSKKTGTISSSGTFFVFDKYDDGTYLWGRVDDGITKGWAVLNYATYLSGVTDILNFEKTQDPMQNKEFTLKWNKLNGAEKYTVNIYKSDGTLVKTLTTNTQEVKLSLPQSGIYLGIVSASNSKVSSWKMQSQRAEIYVLPSPAFEIQSITLEKEKTVNSGKFFKLNVKVLPTESQSAVAWTSSNSSVADVLTDGTVLANKSGTAYIYCTSLTNNSIKAVCKVNVVLSPVSGFGFDEEKTNSNSAFIKWNSVSGADGYRLYRVKSNGKYKLICDTKETFFTDTSLKSATTYCYNVRAYSVVNGKNVYSDFAGEMFLSTAADKVQNLKTQNIKESSFKLSWDSVNGADYYAVYKYNEIKKVYEKVKTTQKTVLKIKKDSSYSAKYKVAAVVKMGSKRIYGEKSNMIYGLTKPKKPTVTASAKKEQVVLSWNKVEGATSYIIYEKTQNGYEKKAVVNSKKLSYTVKKLKSAKNYTFAVRACKNKGGNKAYSSYCNVTVKTK